MVSLGEKAKAMNVTQKRMKRNNTFFGFDPPSIFMQTKKHSKQMNIFALQDPVRRRPSEKRSQ